MTSLPPRREIYYWKSDRPAAFRGASPVAAERPRPGLESLLYHAIRGAFGRAPDALRPAHGQGNHLTFQLTLAGHDYFVRVEDGPEQDDYLDVESRLLVDVASLGVPAPKVHHVDATRRVVPFAWQVLDLVPYPDLNRLHKEKPLAPAPLGREIGTCVARWQALVSPGFGPFDVGALRATGRLEGYHAAYADYFFLHLDRHLAFLDENRFLSAAEIHAIRIEMAGHRELLALAHGCLVHKDLAFWNLLGTPERVAAVIDWDDAIAGDPLDDLSLLGCFHDGAMLREVFAGYASVRPLPPEYRRRFWLHLLRNLLVKSVIRLGAGYFDRTDGFFLIGAGGTGADLKEFTLQRITAARRGLRENADPTLLL